MGQGKPPAEAGPESTGELVRAARRGERAAFDRLFRRFAPVVHGVLLAQVQKADADDLVQHVFETVLHRLPDLREPDAFPAWLLAIARRAAADAHRRRPPPSPLAEEPADPADPANPERSTEARRVLAAIRQLPEAYRETLLLRLVQGLDGQEIADLTGLTAGSVRVNLHRGMARLRDVLQIRSELP